MQHNYVCLQHFLFQLFQLLTPSSFSSRHLCPFTLLLQLQAKLLEAERQLGEVQGRLKEQRQLSGEKLKDREQQSADLQLKLSRAEEQVRDQLRKSKWNLYLNVTGVKSARVVSVMFAEELT